MPASLLTVTPLTASGISHVGFNASAITGLVLWVDAAQITGVTSNTSLSVWTDVSGNGNHLSGVVSKQPKFVDAVQNNQPVVRFISTSHISSAFTLVQPCTVMMAMSYNTTAVTKRWVDGKVTQNTMLFSKEAGNHFQIYASSFLDSGQTLSSNSFCVLTGIFNGSSSSAYYNGSGTSGNANTSNASGICLGSDAAGANGPGCDIGEVLVFNRSLFNAERLLLESYLSTRWGTP